MIKKANNRSWWHLLKRQPDDVLIKAY